MKGILTEIFNIYSSEDFQNESIDKNIDVIFIPKKISIELHPIWVVKGSDIPFSDGFILYPSTITPTIYLYLFAFQLNAIPGIISLLYIKKSGNYRKTLTKSKVQNFHFYEIANDYVKSIAYLQSLIQSHEKELKEQKINSSDFDDIKFRIDFFSEIRDAIGLEFVLPNDIKEKTQVLKHWNEFISTCTLDDNFNANVFSKIFSSDNMVLNSVKKMHTLIRNVVECSLNSSNNVEIK